MNHDSTSEEYASGKLDAYLDSNESGLAGQTIGKMFTASYQGVKTTYHI